MVYVQRKSPKNLEKKNPFDVYVSHNGAFRDSMHGLIPFIVFEKFQMSNLAPVSSICNNLKCNSDDLCK